MNEIQKKLINSLNSEIEQEIIDMLVDMVNIPSPTGKEKPLADYVAEKFKKIGLHTSLQEVESERENVIAVLKGQGGGKSLMFNAHFDTSMTGEEEEMPPGQKPNAWIEDGWIYGLGSCNMKNAFAAYYGAIKMLQKARIPLKGDILVTGVVGEIEKAPIDQYTGKEYRGGGCGSSALMHHGVTADMCICGECTGLRLQPGNSGYIFAKISDVGVGQHTWAKEDGEDAIEKILIVREAIKQWEPYFKKKHPHPTMETRIGIGAIQGGYPFKPAICPAPYCSLYIDIRTLPGQSAISVKHELEEFLGTLKKEHSNINPVINFYMIRDGYELENSHELINIMSDSHGLVFKKPVIFPTSNRYCVSADTTIFGHYGIPSITYGAGGIVKDGRYTMYDELGECVGIEQLIGLTKVYALAALEICR